MEVGEKTKSHSDVIDYFQKVPFYNKHIEKTKIKCLNFLFMKN